LENQLNNGEIIDLEIKQNELIKNRKGNK